VEFAHSQNQHIGIQLAHAGRKASTVAPWLSAGDVASERNNGWPDNVKAPSAIPYSAKLAKPKEMTKADIEEFKSAFVDATKRALKAGFDTIEIHNAHGYLLHEFTSPVSNKRTDDYGGSFENRTRLTIEVVDLVRKTIPKDMPLFLRISASDWLEYDRKNFPESWTEADTVRFAPILADHGVDLLDVSSGGNHPAQKIKTGPGYQSHFAKAVKEIVKDKMAVSTVGTITNGPQAQSMVDDEEGGLDVVLIGRMFQKNPGLVWAFAEELGVEINVAKQIGWGFGGRAGGKKKQEELKHHQELEDEKRRQNGLRREKENKM
jgi:2,4-dienoyl-CoA reductase-like NADH-dependent reductase (Old Yellow Enzyme family)